MSDPVEVIARHLYEVWCCEADEVPAWNTESDMCRDPWREEARSIVNALLNAGLTVVVR
jgi:hypothetical protein